MPPRSPEPKMNARHGELSEALETVKRLQHEIEAKVVELDQALDRVRSLTGDADSEAGSRRWPTADAQSPGPTADAKSPEVTEGLRIIVIQMTASGSTREEIAERLEGQLGIADGRSVVATVLDRA